MSAQSQTDTSNSSTGAVLRISGISLEHEGGTTTLRADCGGFELYYSYSDPLNVARRADPFVAACLLPAMSRAMDIVIDDDAPVSPTLLDNLQKVQTIFSHWEGQLGKRLIPVRIIGGDRRESAAAGAVCAFFSGGVDGSYTFLKHRSEIDFLLFAKGIDMQLSSDALFNTALEQNRSYLSHRGKPLVTGETNVRFLGHEYGLGWSLCFGGGLSSIALAAGVSRCYLASGVTYAATIQEGSNYITDHLWSSGLTQIVHDGAEVNRLQKIQAVAEDSQALEILRVCWQDSGYNCGKCSKCLRTMVELRLLGLRTPTFPELTDAMIRKQVAAQRVYTVQSFSFIEASLAKAYEVGDRELIRVLGRLRRDYLLRMHLRGLKSAFTAPRG